MMLVTGRGPFDAGLIQPGVGQRGAGLERADSASSAAARDWRTEMVWFESVNRQAETARPAVAPPPTPDEDVDGRAAWTRSRWSERAPI